MNRARILGGSACCLAMPYFLAVQNLCAAQPTFYRDVLPILQNRCQECHRPGEIGPMPLLTYQQTRPWAKAIREAVRTRTMPPWFADPCCGKFANDRSLSATEIDTLATWADSGASLGDESDSPPKRDWPADGNLPSPDAVLAMPRFFDVPAKGDVEYQRFVIPTGFDADRWVQAVEVRPGARAVVHHVVVYIREPGDTSLSDRRPFTTTRADMLALYAPGTSTDVLPAGMARLVPRGSDLVMEIHYTPNGRAVRDRTAVTVVFAKEAPQKRVLTLQMQPERLLIRPGDPNARASVWGTLPNDALLLGFFPHMHLRGKAFEYSRMLDDGTPDTLLRVSHYNFHWQLAYRLVKPVLLKKGTRLALNAWYDNSANNPFNPDPSAEVHWGEQSWEEMMVGFFDVAVDPRFDRKTFFVRP